MTASLLTRPRRRASPWRRSTPWCMRGCAGPGRSAGLVWTQLPTTDMGTMRAAGALEERATGGRRPAAFGVGPLRALDLFQRLACRGRAAQELDRLAQAHVVGRQAEAESLRKASQETPRWWGGARPWKPGGGSMTASPGFPTPRSAAEERARSSRRPPCRRYGNARDAQVGVVGHADGIADAHLPAGVLLDTNLTAALTSSGRISTHRPIDADQGRAAGGESASARLSVSLAQRDVPGVVDGAAPRPSRARRG